MTTLRSKLTAEPTTPAEALADLCDELLPAAEYASEVDVVPRQDLPEPFRRLLDHHNHMTTTLQTFHGSPVSLHVLKLRQTAEYYHRAILLRLQGTESTVEFGIVRIHLAYIAPDVKKEILEQKTPLGDILIRHNVLRRIEPRWFLKFRPDGTIGRHFGPARSALFGRLGVIHYDGHPAIELLEVVSAEPS